MYDNDMTNILKNFAGAGSKGGIIDAKTGERKVNHAAAEKNAMKAILEGLDAQQTSVNQMPSTHKMGKNGAKHPASKFLVGGEYDEYDGWPDRGRTDPDSFLTPDEDDDEEEDDFHDGMRVELKPNYADTPGEVYTLSAWDGRKGWIGDKDGRGWGVRAHQIMPAAEAEVDDDFSPWNEAEEGLDEATPTAGAWEPEGITKHKDEVRNQEDNYTSHRRGRIQPGVNVHIGHRTPGGSGVEGEVTRVKDGYVYIKNASGQTYKGQLKNTTVNEAAVEEDTIAQRTSPKTQMNKKQSFKDVFRSMDETEEDMSNRFKKELHDEREERTLKKGQNGKFDLAEDTELEYDVEVYPPYNIALVSGGRVVAKIDIEDWKMLNRKVIKELRIKK